jgi:hypothetical protein
MAGTSAGTKWKSEKALQQLKREVPATLQPLDYTPTPKENIDLVQVGKVGSRGVSCTLTEACILTRLSESMSRETVKPASM